MGWIDINKTINFNDGYFSEGGSFLHKGNKYTIKNLHIISEQNGPDLFNRDNILILTTKEGKVFQINQYG